MADVIIKKIDNVHIKVLCDAGIQRELNDHFSFDTPGAKFHPLVKARKWDGKIRLFHILSSTLYVGLKPYLEHFCSANNYTVDYSEWEETEVDITYEKVEQFCKALKLSLPDDQEIRDYQIDAIYHAIRDSRRLLQSPTGSGKSLIIYCLLRWHEQHGRKQLIIVPTTSLVEQMYSDFASYSKYNGWKVENNCARIYSGYDKNNNMPVTISTWQSVYTLPNIFFKDFHVIFGDEAHQFKAKSLTSILNKLVNAPFRIGTSGTLDGTKVHKLVLEGLFGPLYKVTTTRKLIDNNQLADLKINFLILQYSDDIKKGCYKFTYPEEMDFLVQYEPRNKFIRNLTLAQKNNTLVLFQYVEKHGKVLYDMINKKINPDRKVSFVYGGTETEQRENIRRITETETNSIIIASYGTFSTGINIKNLHCIIFASPTKSRIRTLQSIGRGLRVSKEKDKCKLYDIGDDLTWKDRKNHTLKHVIERIKIYNDEHLDYNMAKVDLG